MRLFCLEFSDIKISSKVRHFHEKKVRISSEASSKPTFPNDLLERRNTAAAKTMRARRTPSLCNEFPESHRNW